jgi:basic membrane protein A
MKRISKLLALVLVLVMMASLAACGSAQKSSTTSTKDPKSDLKVGFIYIGATSDKGYTYAHDQGALYMQKELGLRDDQILKKEQITEDGSCEAAIKELVEAGCKIIFGTSYGYMNYFDELSKEYPDVIFSHCSGFKSNGTNFNNYFGRIYQARYLSGIAAGMKTQSDLIGYVAAMGQENSEVTGGIDAFAMGVYSVNPDAKVYVKVTNSWFSPEEETNAAKALLAEGCDVIAQHCDTPNPQLEAEKAGKFGVGYNSDMSKDAPKATLTSTVWDWSKYYTWAVDQVIKGTWNCENYYGGMKEGLVNIAPLNEKLVAEGTAAAIEKARKSIMDGTFNVFDGVIETNDGKKIGAEGKTLDDATITGKINWYFKNVTVK